jgi:hypothetical protein
MLNTLSPNQRITQPPLESLDSLALTRPSGAPFVRPFANPDVTSAINAINDAIVQNQVGAPAVPEASGARPLTAETCLGNAATTPQVRLVAEAFPEQWEEARVRNARILGRAALYLAGKAEMPADEAKKSLSNLFKTAHEGDETAKSVLTIDGTSSVVEMACKTGARMKTEAEIIDGQINQFGRTTEERQYNTRTTFSYQFPGLDEMSKVEGQNVLALEQAIAEGKFKKGDVMVECSLVPAAEHTALKGTGLFLREVIAIIRTTRLEEGNKIVIESHLVSGTDQSELPAMSEAKTEAAEEQIERLALANRFDVVAFRKLLAKLGVKNTESMTPTDILATPLYVAGEEGREALDGVRIAMSYDGVVAELTGKPVMMGSADLYQKVTSGAPRPLTRADYEGHFARMEELQADLKTGGEYVARQCALRWREVAGDDFAAGRLMHELSEHAVVHYLAERLRDEVADPEGTMDMERPDMTVMGVRTYQHLMEFQGHLLRNDLAAAGRALHRAEDEARGSGCPLGLRNKANKDGTSNVGMVDGVGNKEQASEDEDDGLGPRIFRCKNDHINIRKRGELLAKCQTAGCAKGSVGCEEKPTTSSKVEKMAKSVLKPLAIEGLANLIDENKKKQMQSQGVPS